MPLLIFYKDSSTTIFCPNSCNIKSYKYLQIFLSLTITLNLCIKMCTTLLNWWYVLPFYLNLCSKFNSPASHFNETKLYFGELWIFRNNVKIKSLSIIVFSYIFNLHASSGALLDIVSEVSYMAYGSVVISVNTGCCFYNKYISSNKKLYEMKKTIKSSQYLS